MTNVNRPPGTCAECGHGEYVHAYAADECHHHTAAPETRRCRCRRYVPGGDA